MTRREAIEWNKNLKMYMKLSDRIRPYKFLEDNYIALDMAIQALEQDSSEDMIGRQAVLDKAYAYGNGLEPEGYCVNVEDIQALPSVTPQSKMGQWLPCAEDNGETVRWVCSSCRDVKSITKNKTEFCPVCGARMGMTDREIVDKLTELTAGSIGNLDLNDAMDLLCEIKRILSRRDRSE